MGAQTGNFRDSVFGDMIPHQRFMKFHLVHYLLWALHGV